MPNGKTTLKTKTNTIKTTDGADDGMRLRSHHVGDAL